MYALEVGRPAVKYRTSNSTLYNVLQITIDINLTKVVGSCNGGINGG